MLKFLLLVVLLFFALGVAVLVMRRLMDISQKIADLQTDMKKSQVSLDAQMQVLKEKQEESGNIESNDVEEKNS